MSVLTIVNADIFIKNTPKFIRQQTLNYLKMIYLRVLCRLISMKKQTILLKMKNYLVIRMNTN